MPQASAPAAAAPAPAPLPPRVWVDGKFLRLGDEKFWVKGVTYGPFAGNSQGLFLPEPDQLERDLRQIRELGANTLRLYHAPTPAVLDRAQAHGLKVLVDIPWSKHRCFIDDPADQETGRAAVRETVRALRGHPAVLAYSVVNEIPTDVARWSGHDRVERFIDELVEIGRAEDPQALFTFASYPPTEYLQPRAVDFYTMNVYLHARERFRSYLGRLQNQVDEKPLLLGEYGIDSIRNGVEEQAALVGMHLEEVFRAGLAGSCVFSFTDDWHTGGHPITDWAFGLTDRERRPKPAFARVARTFRAPSPLPPLPRTPRVSVVVCSYNGSKTLDGCLRSLERLVYPDYEVILVDDGSTDAVPQIAARYPFARYHHQPNRGLSAARNTGLGLARGELVVYTDDDCFADEDWLYFLVAELLQHDASAVGGPNFLPTKDGPVAACVSASPGSPAHILIDDHVAEHIPGCNMAFWRDRLQAIGGFDPLYTKAGDDVDVCWRLQAEGDTIVYSPAAMVWHHRRATVKAYLKQQRGYGEAEALLKRNHPEKFQGFQANLSWRGRIYTRAGVGVKLGRPVIHFGPFATGLFQTIYSAPQVWWPLLATSIEWWVAIALILGLAVVAEPSLWLSHGAWTVWSNLGNPLVFLPATMVLATLAVAWLVAGQATPPVHQRRWWSRLLIAAMHVLQPVARGYARYQARFRTRHVSEPLHALSRRWEERAGGLLGRRELALWSEDGQGRDQLLERLVAQARAQGAMLRADSGWEPFDLTIRGDRWSNVELTTVTEEHGGGRRLTRVRARLRATPSLYAILAATSYLMLFVWLWEPAWEVVMAAPATMVVAVVISSSRRLRRVAMASVLSVAEALGMSVVGAPGALRRPEGAAPVAAGATLP
ncbi:MAG: glycosyltransferase [Anaeromyxobacter sp.]|nr:glycosyltransferase [Anaeromyxobacter sp.]MBL0277434.1 glycosyltransferase [Anaeromyxobacter sp.]